ncbi:LysR family transcriptional regulator [Rhizobium rhizogenes]|uniref:LysR family transcriptional regulator n=1 Tax=Rhizobium TaxID=379 RepID=UPI00026ED04C|nr:MULTISPECIES: LysR family transcriptional regulator [Rhizobium]OCJ24923.1 LysR family transcriptional regulator [Agrobacterium sp. B131/95]EJK83503.1 transcriptional regulator [Rhizobium sp. AP16]KEA07696.1 LysR family transcriptional regulator [Rhizobium rhizogenes]MDJ1633053.1 LysR family transcriptional regulator [Rhizobium rhizogenes]MQB28887.1 LysR family transcriptional regulator [Rhizobium rhizogenes]
MDRLSGLNAFVRSADLGSFAAAGRVLGLSASAVGKAVTNLERQLGVRLMQRSTRSIRLTEEGRLFHERCRRVLDDLEDAQASLAQAVAVPRGRLRVSVPIVSYHFLLPVLPEFVVRYPEVELDIDFNDRIVDMIEEGVDVAIRSGDLPDSRLMSRTLRPFQMLLCAAPAYLERHGVPDCPRALDDHLAIRFRFPNSGKLQNWPLNLPDGGLELHMKTALSCNNMEALRGAVISGLGIGCMPDFLARSPLAEGKLRTVLDDHIDGPGHFHLLWPSNRHLSPKVRVFVDFLSERLFAKSCDALPGAASA